MLAGSGHDHSQRAQEKTGGDPAIPAWNRADDDAAEAFADQSITVTITRP
jgi:hypothetical protein